MNKEEVINKMEVLAKKLKKEERSKDSGVCKRKVSYIMGSLLAYKDIVEEWEGKGRIMEVIVNRLVEIGCVVNNLNNFKKKQL